MKWIERNKSIIVAIVLAVLLMYVGVMPALCLLIGGIIYILPTLIFGSFMKKAKKSLNDNKFEEAIAKADQAIKLPFIPKSYLAFISLVKSDALQRTGRFKEALDVLKDTDTSQSTEMLQSNYHAIKATSLLHTGGAFDETVESIKNARKNDGRVYLEFMEIYANMLNGTSFSVEEIINQLSKEHMELRDYDFNEMEEQDIIYRLASILLDHNTYVDVLKIYYLGKILEGLCEDKHLVGIYGLAKRIPHKSYFKSYCNRFVRVHHEKEND